jgi:hypothetical protein
MSNKLDEYEKMSLEELQEERAYHYRWQKYYQYGDDAYYELKHKDMVGIIDEFIKEKQKQ